ncbi:MAG: Gfo/Idh/MocA family protein [Bacillota bacterium]
MPAQKDKIGIGVLGLGGRGVYFAGKKIGGHKDCQLVGLCDIDEKKIETAQNILGEVSGTTSIEEFLQFPGLDAVVICTPDHTHADMCIKVLKAEKHVYLEKPMAQKIEDCDRMIDVWKESGVVFMVGLELRYCTLMQDMKKLIEQGEVGDIKIGNVVDNVSVGGDYYYHGKRRKKEYVKSLILEKGTHSLDLTNWLVDSSPVRVYCSAGLDVFGGNEPNDKRCRDCEKQNTCPYYIEVQPAPKKQDDLCVYAKECDVHDNSQVLIDYEDGTRINYMECHFTPEYNREFTFVGNKGKIYGFYNNEQEFKIRVQKRHSRKWDVYFPERTSGGHGGGDNAIINEFVEYVKKGKPAAPGIKGARDSAAIGIAAAESAETGMPVEIPLKDI